jgi:hypothetical protein
MKKLALVVLAVLLFLTPTVVLGKEAEPPAELPKWATPECLTIIYKIVQHETGAMKSDEVFRFMAEQIVDDLARIRCKDLTRSRWAIGPYPISKVTDQVRLSVLVTVLKWPNKDFPDCTFIGSQSDRKVWASYGYDTTIGYSKTVNSLTVVGVDCK